MHMRSRPRTYPYQRVLPYASPTNQESVEYLEEIIENLFVSIRGGDLSGVFGTQSGKRFVYWTRELSNWLKLKFDMPVGHRVKLVRLYFDICLQATDLASIERYANILSHLSSDQTFTDWLREHPQLSVVEWDRYFNALLKMVPANFNKTYFNRVGTKGFTLLTAIAFKLQVMPDECDFDKYWSQILALVSGPMEYLSDTTVNLLLVFVSQIPKSKAHKLREIMPMLFYIWDLVPPTTLFEVQLLYCLATIANNAITAQDIELSEYGIFTKQEMGRVFAALHRLLVARKSSLFDHGQMTFTPWVIVSCLAGNKEPVVLDYLESLVKAVEPYCHPSNGESSQVLGFIADCADLFTTRHTTEQANERGYLEERRLTPEMCSRFTLIMLEPLIYGLYSKSRTTVASILPAVYKLAYVCPDIVIPRLLREIYPYLQGFHTPHRTLSCLSALAAITPIMVRIPKFAFHLPALLELVVPCIDPNDPLKTFLALRFIQIAAISAPLWPLGESGSLAQEHVANTVAAMESPNFKYPEYTPADSIEILKSSTMNFDAIAAALVDRVLAVLENMPEKSNEIRNSPEYNLTFFLPYACGCVFNSVSPDLLDKLVTRFVDEFTTNPMHNAVDLAAHIARRYVIANPAMVFPRFFAILDTNIRYEVCENGAGKTRAFGSRDRNFIWYLSILNMSMSTAGKELLPFGAKILSLVAFLRANTKGQIVYHITNTIHHAITALVSYYCDDLNTVPRGSEARWQDWGAAVDLDKFEVKWHIPSPEEIKFAIEMYTTHINLSLENISTLLMQQVDQARSPTEFSDELTNNLTYIRTTSSAISVLLDPEYEYESTSVSSERESDFDPLATCTVNIAEEEDEEEDDDDEETPTQNQHKYNANTYFPLGKQDPLYVELHETHGKAGEMLLQVLCLLLKERDTDTQALKSVLSAVKVWFSDVGIEKSARNDHYQKSIYATETRIYKIKGLRKALYPRTALVRRAYLYHLQRLASASTPRKMTALDRALLLELVNGTLSIYPDIRRNAQSALYSSIKVLSRSRSLVYPRVLKAAAAAIPAGDFKRAESALLFLSYRSMSSVVKRQFNNIYPFFQLIFMAIKADNQQLNLTAFQLAQRVVEGIELPVSLGFETNVEHELSSKSLALADELGAASETRRSAAAGQIQQLIAFVNSGDFGDHWRSQAMALVILNATLACPQLDYNAASLGILSKETLSQNPVIRRLAQDILTVQLAKMYPKSMSDYNFEIYRLDYPVDKQENDCNREGGLTVTSDEVMKELRNVDAPPRWFFDSKFMNPYLFVYSRNTSAGWLKWPTATRTVPPADSHFELKLRENDMQQLREWASTELDKKWLETYVNRSVIELKEDENEFQLMNAMVLKYVLVLVDAGLTKITLKEWCQVVREVCDHSDTDWHRVLAEMAFACCNSQPLISPAARETLIEAMVDSHYLFRSRHFGHESLGYMISSLRNLTVNLDFRRVYKIFFCIVNNTITESSGTRDSFRLAIRTELINIYAWRYPLKQCIIDNLCQNFGHPLESIRTEVAKQLAQIIQSRPYHCLDDISKLDLSTGVSNPHESERFSLMVNEVMDQIMPQADEDRLVDKARAFCSFVQLLVKRPTFNALNRLLVYRVMPSLFQLSMIRDDPDLIRSLNSVFEAVACHHFSDESLPWIVGMLQHWAIKSSWHQKIRALLFLRQFYCRNMFRFSQELKQSLLNIVQAALVDGQVEVRELASGLLMTWVMCESPRSRSQLIERLKKDYSNDVTAPKAAAPKAAASSASSSSSVSLVKRHGAALGLGALVSAFPYEIPLPLWIPETLSVLARYSSGGGIIEKSVKKTFSDFKRSRQDTWHLDQKMFDQDQLDSLEGVLFRNYFV